MTDETPTHLYVGLRASCAAELSDRVEIYPGKYLVCPCGVSEWDCIGADNLPELNALVSELRAAYPEAILVRI